MRNPSLILYGTLFGVILTLPNWGLCEEADPVRFNRDIRPILSNTCFLCHGFDPGTRKADMRLDIRDAALKETKNGVTPIVPGKPELSEIIDRIFDKEDPMPPKKAHKDLTEKQKNLIRRWIAEGAVYEPHWAYAPLVSPLLPEGRESANPIDAFIRDKLGKSGLTPSPAAPDHTLRRRLSLDLVGLPPSAALSEMRDGAKAVNSLPIPDLIDALLDSPHHGERMAVWWLDVARFADTVGFHGDQNQRIFPYRDYVIEAFRSNKRFDQFTREQLAGDLLPHPTKEQLVATGYNRLNMMTREGGAQPKEYLAKYGAERVRSVSAAWFGSTFGCAECHDHKFDPILAKDFYELAAFFADVKQWGVYSDYGYSPEPELKGFNNDFPFPPEIEVESPWLKNRYKEAQADLAQHLRSSRDKLRSDPAATRAEADWQKETTRFLNSQPSGWQKLVPERAILIADGKEQTDQMGQIAPSGSVKPSRPTGRGESLRIEFSTENLPSIVALRIEVVKDEVAASDYAEQLGAQILPIVMIEGPDGKKRQIPFAAGGAGAKRSVYRNGSEIMDLGTGWFLPWTDDSKENLSATWIMASPIAASSESRLTIQVSGDNRLPLRFSISPLGAVHPLQVASAEIRSALQKPSTERSAAERDRVEDAFLLSTTQDIAARDRTRQLAATERLLSEGRTWSMITQARPDPLTIRLLPRGDWLNETGPVVLPSTPSFLPGRIESSSDHRLTRLDLANWILSDANPITARTVMNRVWAIFFGTGLSAVLDDLGSQGEPPSHPELLDWLACEFRESGWDLKHIIRLIVSSETYCQSSVRSAESIAADPDNRLLASQNARRLEAEFVRDNALAISGLLQLDEVGGPSGKPYQPPGYYEALQFPNRDYVADTDARQWRRGLYTHWQRTFLHPMLANFDAPARDECAAARTVSNTPQQALTLLNDPTFVEAARAFAARLLLHPTADDQARLESAFALTLDRPPKVKESENLLRFLNQQREEYRKTPEEAAKLIAVGLSPHAAFDPVEHAAWTQVARVLLNTQESITRY